MSLGKSRLPALKNRPNPRHFLAQGGPLTVAIILFNVFLAIALAIAFVREHRLRCALEQLLKRLLSAWRPNHANQTSATAHDDPDPSNDERV